MRAAFGRRPHKIKSEERLRGLPVINPVITNSYRAYSAAEDQAEALCEPATLEILQGSYLM